MHKQVAASDGDRNVRSQDRSRLLLGVAVVVLLLIAAQVIGQAYPL